MLGMVVNARNPSTWEGKVGRLRVGCQPGLHNETLHQTKQNKTETNKNECAQNLQ
jgi:hypothetical protein